MTVENKIPITPILMKKNIKIKLSKELEIEINEITDVFPDIESAGKKT